MESGLEAGNTRSIAEHPDEGRDRPSLFLSEQAVDDLPRVGPYDGREGNSWIGRTSMDEPASRKSTSKRLMPSVLRATSSARLVRASSRSRSECWTRELKTFCPLTR